MSLESPNWFDYNDRKLYLDLFYFNKNDIPSDKKEFVYLMYKQEQMARECHN